MTEKKDPLEGFQLIDYDAETKTATIAVHPLILSREDQQEALTKKAIQFVLYDHGHTVEHVVFVPRAS